jgi:hypothetical protein
MYVRGLFWLFEALPKRSIPQLNMEFDVCAASDEDSGATTTIASKQIQEWDIVRRKAEKTAGERCTRSHAFVKQIVSA